MSRMWKIAASTLDRNLSEAHELANVLQEASPHIQVKQRAAQQHAVQQHCPLLLCVIHLAAVL